VAADSVLAAERSHQRFALACLIQMQADAERLGDSGVDALASEGLGRLRAQRLEELRADSAAPPFFGRTDRDDNPTDSASRAHADEVLHVGRRHIRNATGDPVVIDWRAPIARPFYRATPADRQGVTLRRRFGFAGAELTSFEDERLDLGEDHGLDSDLLRAEIERPRVGPMRDIVATIQPDQDQLVRADLDSSLCVQGAPGTGKTAVGLHRAAYLLYSYPDRLRRSGVLVVGPNTAFLRYIAQVLPALGESGITQSTVDDLVSPTPARGAEDVATATLKGDARMAGLLRRAVLSHVGRPETGVLAIVGTRRYRVQLERARRYIDDTRRSLLSGELKWQSGRARLQNLIAQDVRRQREDAGGAPSDTETNKLARSASVREFVDQVWPVIEPRALLARLYTEPEFLHRCAGDTLTEAERAALGWAHAPKTARTAKFSPADLVLLDEIAGLLVTTDSYVHVVVDEAQDLSAMQCRAVARRCPTGSITVLGDLAQATTAWAPGSWEQTLAHLGKPDTRVAALTVGYRVPGPVLAVANRLLPHIAPEVPPATSVRGGPDALQFSAGLLDAVAGCLALEGSVALICADDDRRSVEQQLDAAGVGYGRLDGAGEQRLTVVPASAAKGLEFDSVVLVEPSAIVAAEATRLAGLRRLYVAWTRAVSRLAVVHTEPLPPELAAATG
jgi:DNA helicase IV